MTMLQGYAHMVDFFTSFDWWKTDPHDELATSGNYCLAKPGEIYAVYLPRGGNVTLRLQPGRYEGTWWNPSTGEKTALPPSMQPLLRGFRLRPREAMTGRSFWKRRPRHRGDSPAGDTDTCLE